MSTTTPKRIKALVVDDEDAWGEGLETQSRKLSTSQMDVEFKNRFSDALKCIQENPDIDVVVVDLFLDDKLAFDFIFEARKLGALIPFVIVSQVSKTDIASFADKDLISGMIQSSAADFIEKSDIKRFLTFQQKIRDAMNNFHKQTEITIQNIEKRQREYLIEAYYVISELRLLRDIIFSYFKKVKISSFENICSAIDDRLNRIEHFLGSAYFDLDPHPQSRGRVLTPTLSVTPTTTQERKQELDLLDMVPYCPQQRQLKKRLIADCKTLQKKLERRADIHDVCKKLHSELASVADDSVIESVFFRIADKRSLLTVQQGIEVIYQLSLIYEDGGKKERIPALDAAAAIMLLDDGKVTEAAAYLKSARQRAAKLGNETLVATIDAIIPEEAAIENASRTQA